MIRLESVSRSFRNPDGTSFEALKHVDLEVRSGETLCLLGGSGSGKTTCLRLINRLESPTQGRVLVDGVDTATLDVIRLRRSMGYVIQRGGLFPHMTVAQNIGLLGKLQRWSSARIEERLQELLHLMKLHGDEYANRYPSELSGGQRQRVGVARALFLDPPIVLLDEPFGALDPITRRGLQEEFLELRRTQTRTTVLVTHDIEEALLLADRIALLDEGRMQQIGTPDDLMERPANDHVAAFMAGQGTAQGRS